MGIKAIRSAAERNDTANAVAKQSVFDAELYRVNWNDSNSEILVDGIRDDNPYKESSNQPGMWDYVLTLHPQDVMELFFAIPPEQIGRAIEWVEKYRGAVGYCPSLTIPDALPYYIEQMRTAVDRIVRKQSKPVG